MLNLELRLRLVVYVSASQVLPVGWVSQSLSDALRGWFWQHLASVFI